MEISKTRNGGELVVALSGRLDTTTAPELEQALEFDGVTSLVFDFAKIEYISSAGLRVLLGTHKKMQEQGTFVIINANDIVKEVFDMTGLSDVLSVK